MSKKEKEFRPEPRPWWLAPWSSYQFPVISGPKCKACHSTAGVRDGCCAACFCPIPERQQYFAPVRVYAFPVRA